MLNLIIIFSLHYCSPKCDLLSLKLKTFLVFVHNFISAPPQHRFENKILGNNVKFISYQRVMAQFSLM